MTAPSFDNQFPPAPTASPYQPAPGGLQGYNASLPPAPAGGYQPVLVQNPQMTGDTVGSWMLAQFITMIPIVGFIYLLVVAFGGTPSLSRRNWARAAFAWQLIAIAIFVIIAMLGGLGLYAGSGSSSY